jgi:hypothetical protein
MPPPIETPDHDDLTLDDLVIPLLHAAIQAGHAVDQLRSLAELHPEADPPAHRQVRQALTTLTNVQHTLINAADEIHHEDPADR